MMWFQSASALFLETMTHLLPCNFPYLHPGFMAPILLLWTFFLQFCPSIGLFWAHCEHLVAFLDPIASSSARIASQLSRQMITEIAIANLSFDCNSLMQSSMREQAAVACMRRCKYHPHLSHRWEVLASSHRSLACYFSALSGSLKDFSVE